MADLFDATPTDIVPVDNSLLMKAVENKMDAESIRMLVELANKQEDRRAKQDFDFNFSRMQSSFPSIVKGKSALNRDGSTMYKYAPLEELQAICNPIISAHGFSYSWKEEAIEAGKRTILSIRGYGHVQENYFDAPMIQGTGITNPIQVAGIMSTYGKRYTFISGFGLTVAGEDTDGAIPTDEGALTIDLREYINSGKLTADAVKVIEAEVSKPNPDMDKLKSYWKRAKAKVSK